MSGLAIGTLQHGLAITDAFKTYTILTVGDGVAAAVPSLFISVAAAIITTRSATDSSMGAEMSGQLFVNPRPLFLTAGVLLFLGILPGMPHFAFITLALGTGGLGYLSLSSARSAAAERQTEQAALDSAEAAQAPERMESLLKVDTLALEVGYGLIGLVSSDESFLNRIREIRRQAAVELGIIVPSVHVTDNLQLPPREYAVLLRGEKIAQGEVLEERMADYKDDPDASRLEIRWITL